MSVYTIGYEGMALEGFLQHLQSVPVQVLVDVRDVPLSRKRGFSKSALAAAVGAVGIQYLHLRRLGCPKSIRDRYRADNDWKAYTRAFMSHLQAQGAIVNELADLCDASVAALLCYEADARRCHRTYVARAVAALTGHEILHIAASGVMADRAIGPR